MKTVISLDRGSISGTRLDSLKERAIYMGIINVLDSIEFFSHLTGKREITTMLPPFIQFFFSW